MQKIRSRYETIVLRETVSSINFAYCIDTRVRNETRIDAIVRVDSRNKKNLSSYIISTLGKREREKNEYYFSNKKIFIYKYKIFHLSENLEWTFQHKMLINDNNVIPLIVKKVKFIAGKF